MRKGFSGQTFGFQLQGMIGYGSKFCVALCHVLNSFTDYPPSQNGMAPHFFFFLIATMFHTYRNNVNVMGRKSSYVCNLH